LSCHAGRVFPTQTWTSTDHVLNPLDPASCLLCHRISTAVPANIVGIPSPYIGPFSGNNFTSNPAAPGSIAYATGLAATTGSNLHKAHTSFNASIVCTDCHNLSVHFNGIMLGRRLLDFGFAAASVGSVGGLGTKVSSYAYNSQTSSSCAARVSGCHVLPSDVPGSTRSWYAPVTP
jgi:hypothetical protein